MALLFSLREHGTTFATRGRGAELRETVLARSVHDSAVTIDFEGVTHVSYSFADEFVGRLAAEHRDEISVEVVNMAETVERTVCSARERRLGAIVC